MEKPTPEEKEKIKNFIEGKHLYEILNSDEPVTIDKNKYDLIKSYLKIFGKNTENFLPDRRNKIYKNITIELYSIVNKKWEVKLHKFINCNIDNDLRGYQYCIFEGCTFKNTYNFKNCRFINCNFHKEQEAEDFVSCSFKEQAETKEEE